MEAQAFGLNFQVSPEAPPEIWTRWGGNASFLLFLPQIRGHELGAEEG
jgi:hypothetical protein